MMALVIREDLSDEVQLGLWKIEEKEAYFLRSYPWLQSLFDGILGMRSEQRRAEILSVYALLYEMTHDADLRISHDERGCPYIPHYRISISHTKGFAVLLLSRDRTVAVDIEYRSNRVGRVAHKFIRKDENAPDVNRQLLIWSAKETVYKYFSVQNLTSSEIKITIPEWKEEGRLVAENLRENITVRPFYRQNDDYVLTFLY